MKVKEENEKVGLKLNIQKTKIMASGPITSWEIDGPETHVSQQLTWTVLPQEFRDSPHFFGQALQKDL